MPDTYDCPQCGMETQELVEGYCEYCWAANKAELDTHNRDYDRWQGLTDQQRWHEIQG